MAGMLEEARQRLADCDAARDPATWARAQHHLGAVLTRQLLGDPAGHAEEAIDAFGAAAQIRFALGDTAGGVASLTALGVAWKNRIRGDHAQNMEKALECQLASLAAAESAGLDRHTADVHANLGQCYLYRDEGDRAQNLREAVDHFRAAASFYTRESHPTKWAILRTGEGIAWSSFPDQRTGLARAARAYRQAGAALDAAAQPAHARRLGRVAGALHLRRGDWPAALASFEMAVDAGGRLLAAATDPDSARAERADLGDTMCRAAYAAARAGRLERALELAEAGRASVFRSVVADPAPPADRPGAGAEPPPGTAVCYLLSTSVGGGALISFPTGSEATTTFVRIDELTSAAVEEIVVRQPPPPGHGGAVAARLVTERPEPLLVGLDDALERLGPALQDLDQRLAQWSIRRVVLVPYALLGVLPLHMAPTAGPAASAAGALADHRPVSYAPSAAAFTRARAQALVPARPPRLLTVHLPHGSAPALRAAPGEVRAVREIFPGDSLALGPGDVTRDALFSLLPDVTHLHVAGHGGFQSDSPEHSHFQLTGGERLSVAEIMDSRRFAGVRLVVVTACSMGASDYLRLPDEVLGLPAALLLAGAGGVIAPLRPVPDITAALLAARFYRSLRCDAAGDPAAALADAQCWLRDLTARQLREFLAAHPALLSFLTRGGPEPGEVNDSPLWRDQPELWASFCHIGA